MGKVHVVIGGTFDELHVGHIKLISEAFKIGDEILIGVTSDDFATKTRGRKVLEFQLRVRRLREFIDRIWNKKYDIVKIDDPFGPATTAKDLDVIVVSTETFYNAWKINMMRMREGLKPLIIYVINLVKNDYGEKISSTLINVGKTDEWGRSI